MEGKIITVQEAMNVSNQLHALGQKIVLAGGCFDILHVGHVAFLQKAKEEGDSLFVLLESDEYIKKTKGEGRPINTQQDRAFILMALSAVDYVILLPAPMNDEQYDSLILDVKPAIIATTIGDPYRHHKDRQAGEVGATVAEVTDRLPEHSTSTVVTKLEENL